MLVPSILLFLAAAMAADPIPPEAQAKIDEAEAAWRRGELTTAERLYTTITDTWPSLDHGWRRRCGVVLAAGRPEDAADLCRTAVRLRPAIENRTGLALALLRAEPRDAQGDLTPELEEARSLIDGVLAEDPSYDKALAALCDWSVNTRDVETLIRCVSELEKDPARNDEPGTHYFRALLDLEQDDLAHARRALDKARTLGLSDNLYRPVALRMVSMGEDVDVAEPERPIGAFDFMPTYVLRTWGELIPWLVAAGLVLTVGALAFFGKNAEPEAGAPTDPDRGPDGGPRPAPPAELPALPSAETKPGAEPIPSAEPTGFPMTNAAETPPPTEGSDPHHSRPPPEQR